MEAALRKLCADVEAAVQGGCEVLVLSDRLPDGEEVRSSMLLARTPAAQIRSASQLCKHRMYEPVLGQQWGSVQST